MIREIVTSIVDSDFYKIHKIRNECLLRALLRIYEHFMIGNYVSNIVKMCLRSPQLNKSNLLEIIYFHCIKFLCNQKHCRQNGFVWIIRFNYWSLDAIFQLLFRVLYPKVANGPRPSVHLSVRSFVCPNYIGLYVLNCNR